eukprot:m.239378 g.239378  ORF g.239378 m.239378 type:complete len:67 (-) comp18977_c2_seq4:321-521(-)
MTPSLAAAIVVVVAPHGVADAPWAFHKTHVSAQEHQLPTLDTSPVPILVCAAELESVVSKACNAVH